MNKNSGYRLTVAYDYYCLPACLEMIVNEFKGNSHSQKSIGEVLGVDTGSAADVLVGAKVDEKKIRSLFPDKSVVVSYIKANQVEEWMFEDILAEKINLGCHLICTLSSGILLDHDEADLGHAVLISMIQGRFVDFIDPGPSNPGNKRTTIETLYKASRYREGGLIVIETHN